MSNKAARRNKPPKSWELARRVRDLLKAPGVPFSDGEYAVLEEYAWHHNELLALSWPGVKLVAARVNRSERQVQRIVRDLEDVGIMRCVAGEHGGRAGERGIARRYALHILDWPHTNLGCHSYVTLDSDVRVTSEASYGDISTPVRVTFEAPYGDIAVSPEPLENRDIEPREREPEGHLGTSVVRDGALSLSLVNTLYPDPEPEAVPDHQQQHDDSSSAEALAAALGEVGAGSVTPIYAADVQRLVTFGATVEEVRVGWGLLVADLDGKPFTPSVKVLTKQWAGTGDAGWGNKARAEIAKRAKAEQAAQRAQAQADREAAVQERSRLAQEAEELRRAELTPEERAAEDAERAAEERARAEAWRAQKAAQRERILANFARAFGQEEETR